MKKILIPFLIIAFALCTVSCEDSGPDLNTACVMARPYVKRMINFPEEAEFENDKRGSGDIINGFTVYEQFTAPNAFGVKKRYVYKCHMKYLGGDQFLNSSWECSNLIVEDMQTGQQYRSYDY